MNRLCLAEGLTLRVLPDGDAVVARHDGAEAVIVNHTAHVLLELFAKPATPEEIVALFCESFPNEDAAAIRRDVSELIERFVASGMLKTCGSARSIA